MVTFEEFAQQIETAGFPVALNAFESEVAFPYVIYKRIRSDGENADNSTIIDTTEIQVELYTRGVDLESERLIESALECFPFNKTYEFDDEEKTHTTYYTITII